MTHKEQLTFGKIKDSVSEHIKNQSARLRNRLNQIFLGKKPDQPSSEEQVERRADLVKGIIRDLVKSVLKDATRVQMGSTVYWFDEQGTETTSEFNVRRFEDYLKVGELTDMAHLPPDKAAQVRRAVIMLANLTKESVKINNTDFNFQGEALTADYSK